METKNFEYSIDGYVYNEDDELITCLICITKYTGNGSIIEIPFHIGGYKVTVIKFDAFRETLAEARRRMDEIPWGDEDRLLIKKIKVPYHFQFDKIIRELMFCAKEVEILYKTLVFENEQEFCKRKDKTINGVSPKMLEKYYQNDIAKAIEDNKTNRGCWNCYKEKNRAYWGMFGIGKVEMD